MKADALRRMRLVMLASDARCKKLGEHLSALGATVTWASTLEEVSTVVGAHDALIVIDQACWLGMRPGQLRWLLDARRSGALRVVLLASDEGATASGLGKGAVDEVVSLRAPPQEFVLAVSRAVTTEPETSVPTSSCRNSTRPRVLIIDDSELLNRITSAILTRAGFHVTSIVSPFEMYAGLRKDPPDVVLVDYNMPGVRGDVVIDVIKRDGLRTPMILYSSAPEPVLREAAARSGAAGYILKGCAPEVLVDRLETVLREHRPRGGGVGGAA